MFTLGMSEYADELIKLGFSDKLYCDADDCKKYLEYCKKNDMIWFNDSYGTIVHKDFNNYFTELSLDDEQNYRLFKEYQKGLSQHKTLDHVNFIKFKDDDIFILTSSPYRVANMNDIINYSYHVYVIHPQLLNYYGFIRKDDDIGSPLYNVNYAFTKATDKEMLHINKVIYEDIGIFMTFVQIK